MKKACEHTHICPLHLTRVKCVVVATVCPLPYGAVCEHDHPRDMIQSYVDRITKEHNAELRDEQRAARDAYREGQWAAREEQEERF